MSRRPTHVVPPRPAAAAAGGASASQAPGSLPADLTQRSVQWVRAVCPPDAEQMEEVGKRWRIATGQDSGNPERTAGRSKVKRHRPDPQQPAEWHKEYGPVYGEYQRHELTVLLQLWSAPAPDGRSPRDFHAQAVMLGGVDAGPSGGATRLQRLITKDAGPNLLSWEYFQPLTLLGPHRLAWPLFGHPSFQAAIVHRLLVAVEVMFAHKVVHLDLKPENVGLALPEGLAMDPSGAVQGTLALKALPLKLLDFEFSVHHDLKYPGLPPSNDYTSPFARQRLALAAAHPTQSNAWAQAVDWGADLYALGRMLADWVAWGQEFQAAYVRAQRNDLGPTLHDRHMAAMCHAQREDSIWLERFALKLQAQDRPADETLVRQADLTPRPATPLASLRAELAERFAFLRDGARGLDLPFFMQLPPGASGPATPPAAKPSPAVPRDPQPATVDRVAMSEAKPNRAENTRSQPAKRDRVALSALLARHRMALAALALSASAWLWRAELHTLAAQLTAAWAERAVAAELAPPGPTWALRPALRLADTVQPGATAPIVVARADALAAELGAKAPSADTAATRQTAHDARVRYLRALELLAALPNENLIEPAAREVGRKTLLGLYSHSRWLEDLDAASPLPSPPAPTLAALGRLYNLQAWPLAALLAVHWTACYAPEAATAAQQARWLGGLRQLPADAPGRSAYLAFAQQAQDKLAAGQSACLNRFGTAPAPR